MSAPEFWFECPVCKQMTLEVWDDGMVECMSETITICTTGLQTHSRCPVRGDVVSHAEGRYRLKLHLATPFPSLTFRRRVG